MYKIKVNMTEKALYDFLLYHTYSKASGFLINVLGIAIIFIGLITRFSGNSENAGYIFYIIAGIIFLVAVPVQLKMRAKKQIRINPDYNQPVMYTFSDDGIVTETGDKVKEYTWDRMEKTVVTPKTIGIYYGKDLALIIPKWDFGEQFAPIFQMSMYYTETNRLKKEAEKKAAKEEKKK